MDRKGETGFGKTHMACWFYFWRRFENRDECECGQPAPQIRNYWCVRSFKNETTDTSQTTFKVIATSACPSQPPEAAAAETVVPAAPVHLPSSYLLVCGRRSESPHSVTQLRAFSQPARPRRAASASAGSVATSCPRWPWHDLRLLFFSLVTLTRSSSILLFFSPQRNNFWFHCFFFIAFLFSISLIYSFTLVISFFLLLLGLICSLFLNFLKCRLSY